MEDGAFGATRYEDGMYGVPCQGYFIAKQRVSSWSLREKNRTHSRLLSYGHVGRPTPS